VGTVSCAIVSTLRMPEREVRPGDRTRRAGSGRSWSPPAAAAASVASCPSSTSRSPDGRCSAMPWTPCCRTRACAARGWCWPRAIATGRAGTACTTSRCWPARAATPAPARCWRGRSRCRASRPPAHTCWCTTRPNLRHADLTALLERGRADPVGALLAAPVRDTLKRAGDDGGIDGTEPRERLWRALTPQLFRRLQLTRALEAAREAGVEVTD